MAAWQSHACSLCEAFGNRQTGNAAGRMIYQRDGVGHTQSDVTQIATHKGAPHQEITMAYQSINPHNGQVLKNFELLSTAQLETALAAAESCFQTWKHKSYAERATIIHKAAALLRPCGRLCPT